MIARTHVPERMPPAASTSRRRRGRGLLAYWFVTPAQTRPMRVALVESGYVGIALLIGGATILMARYWFTLTELKTAALLAVLTLGFGGLGLAVAGGWRNLPALASSEDSVRRGLAGAMFALAACWSAGAVGVYADGHAWFAGSAVGMIVAVAGYVALPTAAGLLTGLALGGALALSTVDEMWSLTPLSVGLTLVAVAGLLAALSLAGLIRQPELALNVAPFVALAGAQQPLARADSAAWAYSLTLAVGVACFAVYRQAPTTALLPLGVAGVSIAVLEIMWTHTSGATGLAMTLASTGAVLIATGGVGLRLWRTRGEDRRIRRF